MTPEVRSPAISVVIPAYGHASLIGTTLSSVFAQTLPLWAYEVIVVNDGSPDDTAAAVRPFVESGRVRYFEQANGGQASARNRGIAEARGEFVALLDDDDLWPPDKLERQVAALRAVPDAVLAYGPRSLVPEAGPPADPIARDALVLDPAGEDAPAGRVWGAFLTKNWIGSPGQTLIRAAALRAAGGFDPDIWGVDDYDLYLRLAAHGEFVWEPRRALYYRLHAANASHDARRMYANLTKVARKHLRDPRERRTFFAAWNAVFCLEFSKVARRHLRAGRRAEAWRYCAGAVRLRPGALRDPFLRDLVRDLLYPAAGGGAMRHGTGAT